jgi:hypothetical protein
MSTATLTKGRRPIPRRAGDIRTAWSPHERRLRATEGRRRFQEFLGLVGLSDSDPDIWAVGAPAGVDLQRLAGQW